MTDLVKTALNREGRELLQLWGSDADKADEQSAWGDMNNEEQQIHKAGLKWHHLKHLHASAEVSPRYLHTKTRSVGCKHKELEICV